MEFVQRREGEKNLHVDQSVCVWDNRRLYMPFAVFEEHNVGVSGMMWLWRSDQGGV